MRLPEFVLQMDNKALRAVCILVLMFCIVAIIVVWSRNFMTVDDGELSRLLISINSSGWALPMTIFIFVVAAFIGMPQWVLIAICVAAFGPLTGAIYAWIATLTSASVNFWMARVMGAAQLDIIAGQFITRTVKIIRQNAIVTSFAVRLVPTGPFILVNMASGISGMRFTYYLIGTGLGIIPKIAIVALLGQGVLGKSNSHMMIFTFLMSAGTLVGVMLLARRYLRRFTELK